MGQTLKTSMFNSIVWPRLIISLEKWDILCVLCRDSHPGTKQGAVHRVWCMITIRCLAESAWLGVSCMVMESRQQCSGLERKETREGVDLFSSILHACFRWGANESEILSGLWEKLIYSEMLIDKAKLYLWPYKEI